jgi:hypothetical protein
VCDALRFTLPVGNRRLRGHQHWFRLIGLHRAPLAGGALLRHDDGVAGACLAARVRTMGLFLSWRGSIPCHDGQTFRNVRTP